ncbi:MAG: hypothetical protein HRT71_01120, partial [Flavobacteriales bacterium]|nr:hypothetical protein [Flavobacteriales bacterium]
MKIRTFQSNEGDCLLVTTNDGKNILIDGGRTRSYEKYVAPYIANMELELVCVSHTDQDHIQGILSLMDNMMDLRVYEYQKSRGNNHYSKPKVAPPIVKKIWHNAFNTLVSKNDGRIEDMLAFSSAELTTSDFEASSYLLSYTQAIKLSNRLNAKQLNIPLNPDFDNHLIYYKKSTSNVRIGSANLAIIGPFKKELYKFRDSWNTWLLEVKESRNIDNPKKVRRLMAKAKKDEKLLGNSASSLVLSEMGNRRHVTVPNLVSIMFLYEEDG